MSLSKDRSSGILEDKYSEHIFPLSLWAPDIKTPYAPFKSRIALKAWSCRRLASSFQRQRAPPMESWYGKPFDFNRNRIAQLRGRNAAFRFHFFLSQSVLQKEKEKKYFLPPPPHLFFKISFSNIRQSMGFLEDHRWNTVISRLVLRINPSRADLI